MSQKNKPLPTDRDQTSIQLTKEVRASFKRLKKNHGVNMKFAVHRGVLMLETYLNAPHGRGL